MSEHAEDERSGQIQVCGLPVSELVNSHRSVVDTLSKLDRCDCVSLFAGLLTAPQFQPVCIRLEALVHLAVRFAAGDQPIAEDTAIEILDELGHGQCGWLEDPPEDVFAANVSTPQGDFRHIEGVWESATFYLQLVLDLVDELPSEGEWIGLRASVFALLRMSEEMCRRAGYAYYEFAFDDESEEAFPDDLFLRVRERVVFTGDELQAIGVDLEDLDVFVFRPGLTRVLDGVGLQHSPLLYFPILQFGDRYVLAMPTAVSVAIRCFVLGGIERVGCLDPARRAIGNRYADLFRETPPLGVGDSPPVFFQHAEQGSICEYGAEVEEGRFVHFVFWLDSLKGLAEGGLAEQMPIEAFAEQTRQSILEFRERVEQQVDIREGLTVIVGCGVGRGYAAQGLSAHDLRDKTWETIFITGPDLETLSLLKRDWPTLISLHRSEQMLQAAGVQLVNLSGPLNLLALAESQEGHLVPHGGVGAALELPVELPIPTDALIDLRRERWKLAHQRVVALPDGELIRVRGFCDSLFRDDRFIPLYVDKQWNDDYGLRMVFAGKHVTLWGHCEGQHSYNRWMVLRTWLPRIGAVLDAREELEDTSPIVFRICFPRLAQPHAPGPKPRRSDILDGIAVTSDTESREVVIEVDETFDHGLSLIENDSESALVFKMLEGVLPLVTPSRPGIIGELHRQVVPNRDARYSHRFHARRFRDFVRESIPDKPIELDPIYDASLRIGMGWRFRSREDGAEIEGVDECCGYLNAVVGGLLDELCEELRRFDRRALVRRLMLSHESAMVVQQRWRTTSRANLGLRSDPDEAMRTIVQNEMENNAVLLASRVLVEFAICECPEAGELQPVRLMLPGFCRSC